MYNTLKVLRRQLLTLLLAIIKIGSNALPKSLEPKHIHLKIILLSLLSFKVEA